MNTFGAISLILLGVIVYSFIIGFIVPALFPPHKGISKQDMEKLNEELRKQIKLLEEISYMINKRF